MQTNSKIALITGGNRGLGKNMALCLANEGNDIIITYRSNAAEAQDVVSQIEQLGRKAIALAFDISDTSSFDAFATQLQTQLQTVFGTSTLDILINNAGISATGLVADTREEDFDALYNVHLKGVFFLTQKMLPLLNNNGRIINISSGLTRFTFVGRAAYATMKAAIETFTRYLAKEVGSRGITANVVAPGLVETDFTRETFANPDRVQFFKNQTALGRTAKADDIEGVVAFLCSDAARWVTAQRIEASGGMFM